jgi:hypothetical protein
MAQNARVSTSVHVEPTTQFDTYIVDPMPDYPQHAGQFGAQLHSGLLHLEFNYGYATPTVIRAGIDNLRAALDALEEAVSEAESAYLSPAVTSEDWNVVAGFARDLPDIPLAEWSETELRAAHGDR